MPEIQVNTSDAPQTEFPDMPAGDYTCVVKEIELKDGPNAQYLAVTFMVMEGQFQNWKIWDNVTLSQNAAWKSAAFFKALGTPDTGLQTVNTDDFIDRPIIVRTKSENQAPEHGGGARLRVTRYVMHPKVKEYIQSQMTQPDAAPAPAAPAAPTGNNPNFSL